MYFINKKDVLEILEITDEQYVKIVKPIEKLFIDFDKVIDEIDQIYKMKIDYAIMCLTEKVLNYEHVIEQIKSEMKKKQFYIMALISKDSEIIIPDIKKICFDKKKKDLEEYKDYEVLDITKTQIYEFSQLIVETHYCEFFKEYKNFKDSNNNLYKYNDLKYRIGIIKNMISYLKSITFNL